MQNVFSITDAEYDVVKDDKGNTLWDPDLKLIENIPLNEAVETYFNREVLPFVPDAVVDDSIRDERDGQVGIVGYEINFNRFFYKYVRARTPEEIALEIKILEDKSRVLMAELFS